MKYKQSKLSSNYCFRRPIFRQWPIYFVRISELSEALAKNNSQIYQRHTPVNKFVEAALQDDKNFSKIH